MTDESLDQSRGSRDVTTHEANQVKAIDLQQVYVESFGFLVIVK